MKQYTTPEQTAKLIELGLEQPKSYHDIEWDGTEAYDYQLNYSIGELIEMLDGVSELEITRFGSGWGVYDELRAFTCEELIDALYDMVVKLKEEGVIWER
jgi:hypothetical protein